MKNDVPSALQSSRKRGVEVDSEDNDGRTPVLHTVRHEDVVRVLEQAGE